MQSVVTLTLNSFTALYDSLIFKGKKLINTKSEGNSVRNVSFPKALLLFESVTVPDAL